MLRAFTDASGAEWRVWEVLPNAGGYKHPGAEALAISSLKETAFANGWLCFESPAEKRRLAPIPMGWEFTDLTMLEKFCSHAAVVPARQRREPGVA